MLDGTLVTQGPFTPPARPGRFWVLAVLCSAVFLAACASRTSRAPVSDQSTVAPGVEQAAKGTYVVRAGDTLYKIAQDHGMSVARLEQLNDISDPTQLSIGQVLRLDASTPSASASSTTRPSSGKAGTAPAETAPVTTPAPSTTSPAPVPRASDANALSWGWPASGKIIQGYNSTTKGIDIEGPIGSPIYAAAAGKVLYAGSFRGLGNLIILGHGDSNQGYTNGFITVYAHNQTLLVKSGQDAKKGQEIATMGQSDASSPRLHFEIRRHGALVNPLSYLPPR